MTSNATTKHDRLHPRDALQASGDILVASPFQAALNALSLTSLDAVFAFDGGKDLVKDNIGTHRRRFQLETTLPDTTHPTKLYLKRYDRPPRLQQLRYWLAHGHRISFGQGEHETACRLATAGIDTPQTVTCGQQWGLLFEKRSFLMTREVADSDSLERKLPVCFTGPATPEALRQRRDFIRRLGLFVKRFHETGYRHRDLYLAHIFYSTTGSFCLIDLARAFRPILRRRFQIKDLAQLHYSAPREHFSATDRLRFYLSYCGRSELDATDRTLIAAVVKKAMRMVRHNRKHRIPVPFLDRASERC